MHFLRLCLTLAGAVFLFASIAGQASAEVKKLPLQVELKVYSKAKLEKGGKRHFADFKASKKYFGAFYYNEKEDISWYVTNTSRLEVATAIAKKECELLSKGPENCKLYALQVPKDFPANTLKGGGTSREAMGIYQKKCGVNSKTPGYDTVAISDLGDIGCAWDFPTAAAADDAALLECETSLSRYLLTFDIDTRNRIRKAGFAKCQIVERREN